MIDNFSALPKLSFLNLTHSSIDGYVKQLPKATGLYVLAASHGEGIDKQKVIREDGNQLLYYTFSLIKNGVLNQQSINKVLEACSYLDFKHGLILILSIYEKIGAKKLNLALSEYLIECQMSQRDKQLVRAQLFANRLSLFLTLFTLERIAQNKSTTLKEA